MANVRAEILAASRSRTGWQDFRQSNHEKRPMIDSLRLNFEDKASHLDRKESSSNGNVSISSSNTSNNSSIDCKSGRKLGTKVSAIANLFQSLSPPPPKQDIISTNSKSVNHLLPVKSNSMSSVTEKVNTNNNISHNSNQKSLQNRSHSLSNGNSDRLKNGNSVKPLKEEISKPKDITKSTVVPKKSESNTSSGSPLKTAVNPVVKKTESNTSSGSPLKSAVNPVIKKTESNTSSGSSLKTADNPVVNPVVKRTESRVSRFNNAKAIFEKLQTVDNKKSDVKENDIHINEGLFCAKTSFESNHKYIIDSNSTNQTIKMSSSQSDNEIYNNKKQMVDKKTTYSNDHNLLNRHLNKEEKNISQSNDQNNIKSVNDSKSVELSLKSDDSPPVPIRRSSAMQSQNLVPDVVKSQDSDSNKRGFCRSNSATNADSYDKISPNVSAKEELIDKIVLEISDNCREGSTDMQSTYQNLPDLNSCDTSGIPDILDFDECFHGVEMMTEEEAQKLLSRKSWQDLLSDDQLQSELDGLLSANKREENCAEDLRELHSNMQLTDETGSARLIDNMLKMSNGVNEFEEVCGGEATAENDLSTMNGETSIILDDIEYHLLPDGHFYIETPGLPENSDDENDEDCVSMLLCPVPPRKKAKVKFSSNPMKVYSTHSVEDYDRRNEDVDPVVASAEYELEKRIERMEVFPVELMKGPDGLGLSIIGFVFHNSNFKCIEINNDFN
jgi:hypothetical protein